MNGSSTTSTRFTVPPDFEEIQCFTSETSLIDDLQNEDNEAWLIKLPANFNLKSLRGHKIKLHKKTKLDLNDSKHCECSVTSAKEISNLERFNVVVPCVGATRFTTVSVKFEGQICITDFSQRIPQVNLEEMEDERRTSAVLPSGLRQRLQPFGAGLPEKRKRDFTDEKQSLKKKKKNSPTKRKEKKKIKEIDRDDTNDLSDYLFA